jgi:hypothetical protein
MKEDFLGAFLGNRARARLSRVFVFNGPEAFTLVQIAKLSGMGVKAAAREVRSLENIGIIKKIKSTGGKKKENSGMSRGKKPESVKKTESTWTLASEFKHLRALSLFIHEVSPARYGNVVATLRNCGRLSAIIVSGCFMGDTTRPADLIIVADNVNEGRLTRAIKALEPIVGREIRYALFSTAEFRYRLNIQDRLVRDTLDYSHRVLLDRTHLL